MSVTDFVTEYYYWVSLEDDSISNPRITLTIWFSSSPFNFLVTHSLFGLAPLGNCDRCTLFAALIANTIHGTCNRPTDQIRDLNSTGGGVE